MQEVLKGTSLTGGAINLTLATYKIALGSASMSDGVAPVNFSAATVVWANTNEVSGTGWATGGVLLSAAAAGATSVVPTLAEGTTGSLRYDHTNDVSVSGTTLTGIFGCIIYADPVTAPADMVDAMIVAVCFGASYSTSAGIFGIQWAATGIAEIDLTP
jgi:hypothetical protein